MLLHNGLNYLMSDKSKIKQARQKLEKKLSFNSENINLHTMSLII